MFKRFLLPLLALLSSAFAAEHSLLDPSASLRFNLHLEDGHISYSVSRLEKGEVRPVLGRSPLGLRRTDGDFTQGLSLVSVSSIQSVEEHYSLVVGKFREVNSSGTEQTFTFRNQSQQLLTLTVRAFPQGVAFRYGFPGHGSQTLFVDGEATSFQLPAHARVWTQPYMKVDVWAPSYEAEYVNGVAAGTPAPGPQGWSLPLLFQAGNTWALVTESNLEPDHFGVHLEPDAADGLYRVRLPEAEETYGVAPQTAAIRLPWTSPWRAIMVGTDLGQIALNTLVTDLARPSEQLDVSWIKPGVASWSWWSDMSSPADYQKLLPFIDVSHQLKWPYSLIDLGWEKMSNGGTFADLAAYAKDKNVGLLVWYNSAGKHNQVPDAGITDVMNDSVARDAEFARIAALGVKGIKVDFMQSDKQFVVALYHDIIRDAAKHKLLVNFHGATIPRGWERTYPNLVTMEAVRGAEQYWDKNFAEQAQTFHTIYAFTRNAIGPMDYTPTIFTHPAATNPGLQPHLTTKAHELALLVVFTSGIQHVVDSASSLVQQPAALLDFMTALPTAWDESRYIAGSPGELAVFARRKGTTWFLAGINGEKSSKSLSIPLSFLGSGIYQKQLIQDGATANEVKAQEGSATGTETLEVTLAPRGGFAARFQP